MKLVNLNKTLNDLLHMTCLHTILDIQEDEASAIRSFGWGARATA
jgi:hypothetical protein